MAATDYTILRKGKGHHHEGEADGAISPGMAAALAADGKWDQTVVPQVAAVQQGLTIVKEDALQGSTVDTAYADGDRLFLYDCLPGDEINALVKSGEDVDVGDKLAVEGGASGVFVEIVQASPMDIPIVLMKVHDAMTTDLTGSATDDDMGIITGTPGTDAPTLQGVDFGATTSDEKCAFEVTLPNDYKAGDTVTLRCNAAMLTTISDGTATLDCEAWEADGEGAVGSDICATAATTMNSLTPVDIDFTLTPTTLVAGDKLIVRLSFAGSDTTNAGVMIQEISKITLLTDTGKKAQLIALEDSGGALGANTLLACRVLNA